jgi:hypothetical protein
MKSVLFGVAEWMSSMSQILPFRSPTSTLFVLPGTCVMQLGALKLMPGVESTTARPVVGGSSGTVLVVFAMRWVAVKV